MIYQVDNIIKDVRVVLDQNKISDTLAELGDVETLSLDSIIESQIEEGAKRTLAEAPVYLLDGGYNLIRSVYWNENNSGWLLLPDDFMRLIVFEMSDWERAVFSAISVDDVTYKNQSSRFKGLRGNVQRPVCAISIRPEGRVLEFYSSKTQDAVVTRAVYLPYPKIDKYKGINISERCYKAVVYAIASLVLLIYGEIEKSNNMTELAKTSMI